MNKTYSTLLVLLTIITFASGTAFAGAEIYIPNSAEVDQNQTGWLEVEQPDWTPSLAWQQKTLGGFNSQDNQASVYIPYSAEVDQTRGNNASVLPSLVWEQNTLQNFDSQDNQASTYIPCSAEVTNC